MLTGLAYRERMEAEHHVNQGNSKTGQCGLSDYVKNRERSDIRVLKVCFKAKC